MKFAKNKGMSLAATSLSIVFIMLVVYNILVFIIPFDKSGGFWVGYGFSTLAFILTAAVSFYAFNREELLSKVYGVPLVFVVWSYLVVQLIVGVLEIALQQYIPFQFGIAANAVLLGACAIGLIAVDASKEEIERIDEKVKEKGFYVKTLLADVEGLVGGISDDSVKKVLKELAEAIRYSDPMSNSQLAEIENKIKEKTAALAETVEKSDPDAVKALCGELRQLIAERNGKCKILK